MASLVGTTRESVNKWIKFFVHQGWIEFSKSTVTILDARYAFAPLHVHGTFCDWAYLLC